MSTAAQEALPATLAAPVARREPLTKRLVPVGIQALAVGVVLLIAAMATDPATVLVAGGAVILPTYLLLGWLETRRAPLVLSPLSFYFIMYSVNLGASAIGVGSRMADGEPLPFSVHLVPTSHVAAGYLIFLVGSLALHAGIALARPRTPPRTQLPVLLEPSARTLRIWVAFWALGVVLRLASDISRFLGAIHGILAWSTIAALSSFALLASRERRQGPGFWLLLGAGVLVEIVLNLNSGSKAYIMYSFLPVVWLMARDRGLRRYLPAAVGALAVVYLGVVAPIVTAARRSEMQPGETARDRILRAADEPERGRVNLSQYGREFLDRQFDSTAVGFLYGEVQRYGHMEGQTMDYLAYAFVPRAIWPSKPTVTRGAWFNLYLGQTLSPSDVTTSIGQTAIGELYWNFGIPAVILGMLFVGLYIGLLWRIASDTAHRDPARMLLYCVIMLSMVDMPEAGTVLVALTYNLLVVGGGIWLLDRLRPRPQQALR
jgi:hypothetical protein